MFCDLWSLRVGAVSWFSLECPYSLYMANTSFWMQNVEKLRVNRLIRLIYIYIYNIHASSLAQATSDILWYHRPLSCRPISTRVICELKKGVNEKGPVETGTKTFKQPLGLKDVTKVTLKLLFQWGRSSITSTMIIGNTNIPRFWCQPLSHNG